MDKEEIKIVRKPSTKHFKVLIDFDESSKAMTPSTLYHMLSNNLINLKSDSIKLRVYDRNNVTQKKEEVKEEKVKEEK